MLHTSQVQQSAILISTKKGNSEVENQENKSGCKCFEGNRRVLPSAMELKAEGFETVDLETRENKNGVKTYVFTEVNNDGTAHKTMVFDKTGEDFDYAEFLEAANSAVAEYTDYLDAAEKELANQFLQEYVRVEQGVPADQEQGVPADQEVPAPTTTKQQEGEASVDNFHSNTNPTNTSVDEAAALASPQIEQSATATTAAEEEDEKLTKGVEVQRQEKSVEVQERALESAVEVAAQADADFLAAQAKEEELEQQLAEETRVKEELIQLQLAIELQLAALEEEMARQYF